MFILPIIPPYVMEHGTGEALLTHELVPDFVPVFHWCTPVLFCSVSHVPSQLGPGLGISGPPAPLARPPPCFLPVALSRV